MGVYLCMGQQIHETCKENAIDYKVFNSFSAIQDYIDENEKVLVFLGEGQHKIKRKAEQTACEETLKLF